MQTFERRNHGSGVFFPEEIMDVLQSIHASTEALRDLVSDTPQSQAWFAGRNATLSAIAQAFGLAYYPPEQYAPRVTIVTPLLESERRRE